MSYPLPEAPPGEYLRDYPARSRVLPGDLWPSPIEPGFYGGQWSQTLLLTSDHRRTLEELGASPAGESDTVLVVAAGGLPPAAAAAYRSTSVGQVSGWLQRYPQQIEGGELLVPLALGQVFGWQPGEDVGGWKISLSADGVTALGEAAHTPPSLLLARLVGGLRLWLGQTLLFALPLLVFGWQALVWGLLALLGSTLLLALTWNLLPGEGWAKGAVVGAVLGGLFIALGMLVFQVAWGSLWGPALGCLLAGIWMGIVLSGARP